MLSINRIYSSGEFPQNATIRRDRSHTPPRQLESSIHPKEILKSISGNSITNEKVGERAKKDDDYDILKVSDESSSLFKVIENLLPAYNQNRSEAPGISSFKNLPRLK